MWRKVLPVLVVAGFLWAEKPVDKSHLLPSHLLLSQPKVHNVVQFTRKRPTRSAPIYLEPRSTLASWDFETGAQGWTATDGNGDGTTWTVGTTGDLYGNTPPSYGTQYAYYSDDDAGSGAGAGDEVWTSPSTSLSGVTNLILNFGWGTNFISSSETLACYVVFNTASTPDTHMVWVRTGADGDGNGNESIDLTSYLPKNDIVVFFRYVDPNDGWYWAVAVDNVALTTTPPNVYDESITGVSHTPTIVSNAAWVDTVFLRNEGNQDNTFDLFYVIRDTLGQTVDSLTITNFTHNYNPTDSTSYAVFSISGLAEGFYTIDIWHNLANDANTSNDTFKTYVLALDNYNYNGQTQVLLCDLDPALFNTSTTGGGYAGQSGVHLALTLDNLGYVVNWVWGAIPSFTPYSMVMITHGIYPTLWGLPSALVTQMQNYLQGGGKAYAEGGDIWGYSGVWENGSTDQTAWDNLFGIASANDGDSDLDTIYGHPSSLVPYVDGKKWSNDGENNWMDQLTLLTSYNGTLEGFLQNDSVGYICGVAYENTDYNYYTVATDFELAFANLATRGDNNLLFNIVKDGLKEDPVAVAETPVTEPVQAALRVTGLARDWARLEFSLPTAGEVSVDLYNLAGQKVRTLAKGTYSAGTHTLEAHLNDVASGVYFVVLHGQNLTLSQRLVLVR